ncbi:hypothetical protein FPV58_12360 [Mycolicibacterium porcinum]|uniref:hypothetical protein n=1 Tax=Mycolicibacterium porcinum TaxID=39693 RepID=UPI00118F1D10|nr:hypothetical protein [Mycolicibacterium porcinum]TVY02754.1 hypothetical protein FPV58_12360 [Mycolicibacterium porcinum]
MDADLMLAWMSETGEGDIRDLRQRVAWLARNADRNPQPTETGRWLRDMSALAHVEVDWVGGRWAMAPPVAVLLPSCGGTTVLAGCRRLGLVEELGDLLSMQTILCATSDSRLRTPTQVYLQSDSIKDLVEGLNICGVDYGGRAAEYIANRLSPLRLGEPAAPPAYGASVKHLQLDGALRFVDGRLTSHSGLCQISVQGRPSYLYRDGDEWFHTVHSDGVLWALAENGIEVFRWRLERVDGDDEMGTLFIDQGAPLPPLQARALVLCSGQPTAFGGLAKTAIYRNVPRAVADQVARSVRQRLTTIT